MDQSFHVRLPDRLVTALAAAAAGRFQTRSEFIRQTLIDRLKREGLEPNAREAA